MPMAKIVDSGGYTPELTTWDRVPKTDRPWEYHLVEGSPTRSSLSFAILVEGGQSRMWVDGFFKKHLGALHENVRRLISETAPKEIEAEKTTSGRGNVYYKANEDALKAWLVQVWEKMFSQKKRAQRRGAARRWQERRRCHAQPLQTIVDAFYAASDWQYTRD